MAAPARGLAPAVRQATELYQQLATLDSNAAPSRIEAVTRAAARAALTDPRGLLPQSSLDALLSMLRDLARPETSRHQAKLAVAVLSCCMCAHATREHNEERTKQFLAAPGFIESLAAALVHHRGTPDLTGQLCTVVSAACNRQPGPREAMFRPIAALLNAPRDPLPAVIDIAKTPPDDPTVRKDWRTAALRSLTNLALSDVNAAARCAAYDDLIASAAAEAGRGDPQLHNSGFGLLTVLVDCDGPVADRVLSGARAEAVVGAAITCLRRRGRLSDPVPQEESRALSFANITLAAAFRNPATALSAVRLAAEQGVPALLKLMQHSKAVDDASPVPHMRFSSTAVVALSFAAQSDAAWAALPADAAKVWWAQHLEREASDEAPTQSSFHATRAAAAIARRGGADGKLVWQMVEQRPAILNMLTLQLEGVLPGGERDAPETRLDALNTPIAELLALLTREATPEQRRLMIQRPLFLKKLGALAFASDGILAGGHAGKIAAEKALTPVRETAHGIQDPIVTTRGIVASLGLEQNYFSLQPKPPWPAADGEELTLTVIRSARDAAWALDALTGAPGADGEAACDALLATLPTQCVKGGGSMGVGEVSSPPQEHSSGEGDDDHRGLLRGIYARLQARKSSVLRGQGFVPACANCGATGGGPLKKCGGCGKVGFCGRSCQLAAWPEHKRDCKAPGTSGGGGGGGAAAAGQPGGWGALQASAAASAQQQQRPAQQQPSQPAPAPACATCSKTEAEGVKLKRCAGCHLPSPRFCSNACYKAGWPAHRQACKAARVQSKKQQQQEEEGGSVS